MSIEKKIQAMLNSQLRADKRGASAGVAVSKGDRIHKETLQTFLAFLKAARKADEALDFKIKALAASKKPSEKARRKNDEKFCRWMVRLDQLCK